MHLPTSRQPQTSSVRRFSSSRRLFGDTPDGTPASSSRATHTEVRAEDIETIVRQARQTFGQTLPPGYLSDEEYDIYVRLYGPPLRETQPEDVGIPHMGESGDVVDRTPRNALLRELEDGGFEEVDYPVVETEQGEGREIPEEDPELEALPPLTEAQVDYLNVTANNQREYKALMKLQRDFEATALRSQEEAQKMGEEEQPEEEEEEEDDEIDKDEYERELDPNYPEWQSHAPRSHPYTVLGQFGTNPSTVHLPKRTFVEPITELLKRTNMTHLTETAEKLFGGPGLPHSTATPPLRGFVEQKAVQLQPGQYRMSPIDSDAYIATILPGVYASAMSTLVEVRKRLGEGWIRGLLDRDGGKGPRVLDVGGGGAGLAAWQEVLQAEWDVLREEGKATAREPPGKQTVIVGSDHLRHRISRFLHNTTFLPRLPDYLHSAEGAERQLDSDGTPKLRKRFDVIIASHLLMPMDKPYKREVIINNLWAMLEPQGGVLIVLEKGHPRGFEAVADVRRRMLDEFIASPGHAAPSEEIEAPSEHKRDREPGMIVAPCTNHAKCPLYLTPGLSPGRKDFCHFRQRFIRPPYLQRVLGVAHRNQEDIKFSYVVVQRGVQPAKPIQQGKEAADRAFAGYEDLNDQKPNPLSLPRSILPPLKRHGHVTLELCTPAGAIERWVIPKSFSKQAYRDARKAQWGDLWALGAKTRTRSNIRLGRAGANNTIADPSDPGVRAQLAMAGAKRKKLRVVDVHVDPTRGVVGAQERVGGRLPAERRTKGGRRVQIRDILEEAGIDEVEDEEDAADREFLGGRHDR